MTRKDGLCLWLSVALVVTWRAAAWSWPHPADSSPLPAQRMLGLLGLWFVGWGLWAWHRRPAPVTRLFATYCLLSGLHWGGPAGAGGPQARALLLGLYLLLSVTAQCTFLHLALVAGGRALSPVSRWVVYLPAIAATGLFLAIPLPLAGGRFAVEPMAYTIAPSVLWSFVGGFVWLRRFWRSDPRQRREHRLGWVAAALLVGYLPHGLTSAGLLPLGDLESLANLSFALVPWALASSLARPPGRPASARVAA